jgi:hypothetical protein
MVMQAAAGRAPVWGRSGLRIGARGSRGGGDAEASFYRVGRGAGRPGDRGERTAAVVHRHGGGGGRFERGLNGVVVESDEGGCSSRFRSRRGAPGGGTCARIRGGGGGAGRLAWGGR